MARVIIIGGHGKVARLTSPLLVAGGHDVTAVVRATDQTDAVRAPGVTPVVADVETLGADAFGELVSGHDVIVWSAGAGGGNPERTRRVDRDAAITSIQAAAAVGVDRYVMVSWSGSKVVHGIPESSSFHPYAQAKAIADAVLRDSGLDWTIVAPGTLTDDAATGRIGGPGDSPGVPRADVAAVIVACVADPATVHRTLRFVGGSEPIATFVRGA